VGGNEEKWTEILGKESKLERSACWWIIDLTREGEGEKMTDRELLKDAIGVKKGRGKRVKN